MKFRHERTKCNKKKETQILGAQEQPSYLEHQKDSIPFYCSGLCF